MKLTRINEEMLKAYAEKGFWNSVTWPDMYDRNASIYPDREALVGYRMEERRSVTWAVLKDMTDQLAAGFLDLGLKKDDRVLCQLPNCIENVAVKIALEKAGLIYAYSSINTWELEEVLSRLLSLTHINLIGIHFHIGSQITKMSVFKSLCSRINELQDWFALRNVNLKIINLGGGLGIDYTNPEKSARFQDYFSLIKEFVTLRSGQTIHIEPGRSLVGQCGTLISKVLFIKKGKNTTFAVIDAGMTDLIRPALYQAHHKIENLTSRGSNNHYDVVGPVCESSDTFAKYIELPETKRGDIVAIRSAGAYGESMASRYNLRDLPRAVFSDEI